MVVVLVNTVITLLDLPNNYIDTLLFQIDSMYVCVNALKFKREHKHPFCSPKSELIAKQKVQRIWTKTQSDPNLD
jgi:hypothetical protein